MLDDVPGDGGTAQPGEPEPGEPEASVAVSRLEPWQRNAIVAAAEAKLGQMCCADLEDVDYRPVPVRFDIDPRELGSAAVVLVVSSGGGPDALRFLREIRRTATFATTPVIWVADDLELNELRRSDELFDDFLEVPYTRTALETRLRIARRRSSHEEFDVLERGKLVLNLSTYQASIGGRPLALTYMEYELLRFLAAMPMRVHTRQAILQRVWGYDYYGGMRTVDVHVRRLRAKLGQEHAGMIETVRGVGYRFVGDT